MEWWLILLLIFGGLVFLMITGMRVAFCFLLLNILGVYLLWGGGVGLEQLIHSIRDSVTTFTLLPLPLFVLMGEVMFHSGLAPHMIDALDKWLGRLPGRLAVLAVGAGTIFSTLTGVSMSSVAMLGSVLVPEMEKRGYKKPMSLGPILGSGGLAMMIPPSSLAVLLGAIAEISIGKILVAIIIPGLLMAVLYVCYIVIRCYLQPSIAPPYYVVSTPLSGKLMATVQYILPLGFIIFMVIGLMFWGVVTPTEAAATGALSVFILAALYRKLNWEVLKKSLRGSLRITLMMLMIMTGSKAFGQILAFTGASQGLIEFTTQLTAAPILIFIGMMVVVLFLGMFLGPVPIMMITLPLFMPIIDSLGFNPVWFAVVFLLNMEMGTTSPPYGLNLFVMKSVSPPDTTMGEVYRAALPFLYCDVIAMVSIIAFPAIALSLPALMRG